MEYKAAIKGNAPSKANCYKIVTINGHRCLAKTPALKKYSFLLAFWFECVSLRCFPAKKTSLLA